MLLQVAWKWWCAADGDGKESLGFQLQDSSSFCVSAIAVLLSVGLQPAGHQGETLALTKAGQSCASGRDHHPDGVRLLWLASNLQGVQAN